MLEKLLASGRFTRVRVLVTQHCKGSVAALEPVLQTSLDDQTLPGHAGSDIAIVVFDRARLAHRREAAFVHAEPQDLPALTGWLRHHGVRDLVVVMPHAPAALPRALTLGLASLDERAVTEQGFDHVVFVRTAQRPGVNPEESRPQRLADWMLRQLQLMLPATERRVQAHKVAQFVAELAAQLPGSICGNRVAPPELIWLAAQQAQAGPLVAAWLAGADLPPWTARRIRM